VVDLRNPPDDGREVKKPARQRRGRRVTRRTRRLAGWQGIAAAAVTAAVGLAAVATIAWQQSPSPRYELAARDAATVIEPTPTIRTDTRNALGAPRPVFAHSVIPGGAYTVAELRKAIARDRVVARAYEALVWEALRPHRLLQPRRAYVSYRIGDEVFWTKRPVTIPAGETILSDGSRSLRTRCGNGMSSEPMAPVRDDEPSPEALDAVVTDPPLLDDPIDVIGYAGAIGSEPPSSTGASRSFDAPLIPLVPFDRVPLPDRRAFPGNVSDDEYPGNVSSTTPSLPRAVPEPTVMWLLGASGAGWAARALLDLRRRRRAELPPAS
jgi:hypothetical protein